MTALLLLLRFRPSLTATDIVFLALGGAPTVAPAFLRLLEWSPDVLRLIHSIPRPRGICYIRSEALNSAFHACMS
jgi:hypothetical protein